VAKICGAKGGPGADFFVGNVVIDTLLAVEQARRSDILQRLRLSRRRMRS
jgi:hypothetical protein